MATHLLRRLPRLFYKQRRFKFCVSSKPGANNSKSVHSLPWRSVGYFGLYTSRLGTNRLYSTSNMPADGGTSDPEMFRETPSFPPEWIDPSAQAPLETSTPTVADVVAQAPEAVTGAIGGYSPVGLLQTALDFAHTSLHIPWWLAIVSATVLIRAALFPLAVKMQVNAAKIANINPQAQELHTQLMQVKAAGDKKTEAELGMKILTLYQENGCHPLVMFLMPLAQLPIFISFLMALRGMAQLPVESMKTGGILWFHDLTVPDPTFALPLLACATFLCNIEVTEIVSGCACLVLFLVSLVMLDFIT